MANFPGTPGDDVRVGTIFNDIINTRFLILMRSLSQ